MRYVTYTSNKPALLAWLSANSSLNGIYMDNGDPKLSFDKIPTYTSADGLHSISMLDLTDTSTFSLALADGVFEILAIGDDQDALWDTVLDDPAKKAKLDLCYSTTPIVVTELDGNDYTHTPPSIPGLFS